MQFAWKLPFGILAASFLTLNAVADEGCKNPKTPYDQTYCTAKLFLESDNELNESFKELKGHLKKKEASQQLIKVQRKWIEFRNQNCSQAGSINVACNFEVNKNRTDFFRNRARECKVGHCREDLMFTETFK